MGDTLSQRDARLAAEGKAAAPNTGVDRNVETENLPGDTMLGRVIGVIVGGFGFLVLWSFFRAGGWSRLILGVIALVIGFWALRGATIVTSVLRGLLAALVAILVIIYAVAWLFYPHPPKGDSNGGTTHQTSTQTPVVVCEHAVVLTDNRDQNVADNGLRGTTAKEQLDNFKADGKTNAQITQSGYNTFIATIESERLDIDVIVDKSKKCYTPKGWDAYNQVVGYLSRSTAVESEAPATGANNTVVPVPGGDATQVAGPITGNRKAILVTGPDGRQFWILVRCANIVTPGPPVTPPAKPAPTPIPSPKGTKDHRQDLYQDPKVPDYQKGVRPGGVQEDSSVHSKGTGCNGLCPGSMYDPAPTPLPSGGNGTTSANTGSTTLAPTPEVVPPAGPPPTSKPPVPAG